MFNKLKLVLKQLVCLHDYELVETHTVYYPNHEPAYLQSTYKCTKCGKLVYPTMKFHLSRKDDNNE